MQSITKHTLSPLSFCPKHTSASKIYTHLLVSPHKYRQACAHTHTLSHTHIYIVYCSGISIRLWALVSCSYCKAEGLNETIIRTLKSRGPQMIRKSEREQKIKRKRGWEWKSFAIEPIHCSKLVLRTYFRPGCCLVCLFVSVQKQEKERWETASDIHTSICLITSIRRSILSPDIVISRFTINGFIPPFNILFVVAFTKVTSDQD